jgi:hypothetical protein
MTSSANCYQDIWSNNLSSVSADTAFAAGRADKKRVNTWTTTALEHKQFGADIKTKVSKEEDDGWDASAGEKKDHIPTCTQHACGLGVGWSKCYCEDNPVKSTTDASGRDCTAASNNDDSWDNPNAKANEGWGASAQDQGDNICSCSGWGIGDGCWEWHYKDPVTVKPTASGWGHAAGGDNNDCANHTVKASQGWDASAEEQGDETCSCSDWGQGDGCALWHRTGPVTVKPTASGWVHPDGFNNDDSWQNRNAKKDQAWDSANQDRDSSGINDNSNDLCAFGCCTTVGGWDTSTQRWD